MSLAVLFAAGCVVFVIAMTAVFLYGISRFDAWQQRDEDDTAVLEAARAAGAGRSLPRT